jgi:hypothetical protein
VVGPLGGTRVVYLSKETRAIARKQFEHLMKDADRKFGDAPKAK